MATHSVIGDQPPAPRPAKAAEATSISNESAEKPLLEVSLDGAKFWSNDVPSASFLRSMVREDLSKDQRSAGDSSHNLTTASVVTVTRAEPFTPSGCHRAVATADRSTTWVVGPRVHDLGLMMSFVGLER